MTAPARRVRPVRPSLPRGPPGPPLPPGPPPGMGGWPIVSDEAVMPVGTPCTCTLSPIFKSETLAADCALIVVVADVCTVWLAPPNGEVRVIVPAAASTALTVPKAKGLRLKPPPGSAWATRSARPLRSRSRLQQRREQKRGGAHSGEGRRQSNRIACFHAFSPVKSGDFLLPVYHPSLIIPAKDENGVKTV